MLIFLLTHPVAFWRPTGIPLTKATRSCIFMLCRMFDLPYFVSHDLQKLVLCWTQSRSLCTAPTAQFHHHVFNNSDKPINKKIWLKASTLLHYATLVKNSAAQLAMITAGWLAGRRVCVCVCCQDIDECRQFDSQCSGELTCINTIGSYHCGCRRGFVLEDSHCIRPYSLSHTWLSLSLLTC